MQLRNCKRIHYSTASPNPNKKLKKSSSSPESTDESRNDPYTPAGVATVNKLLTSEKPRTACSDSPSDSNSTTLSVAEASSNGTASKSPTKEVDGHVNILDMTLSEVAKLFDDGLSESVPNEDECPDEDDCSSFVPDNAYRVREEFASTVQTILHKHGDILASTSFTGSLLNKQLLENICDIYQKLRKSNIVTLKMQELESMRREVDDCVKVNVNVSWLAQRLDEIYDARKSLQQCVQTKNMEQRVIAELEKELNLTKALVQRAQQNVEDLEEKLETEKAKSEAISHSIKELKQMVYQFTRNSLVDGM